MTSRKVQYAYKCLKTEVEMSYARQNNARQNISCTSFYDEVVSFPRRPSSGSRNWTDYAFGADLCVFSDDNECLTNNGGCSLDATCTNTIGGFMCNCNTGFVGDGFYCAGKSVKRLTIVNNFLNGSCMWNKTEIKRWSNPKTVSAVFGMFQCFKLSSFFRISANQRPLRMGSSMPPAWFFRDA